MKHHPLLIRRAWYVGGQHAGALDLDIYADDLAEPTAVPDLKDAVHVGHSTGDSEVTSYIGRHGTRRVAKAVLISAIPPLMLKTDKNPLGLPIDAFDGIRAGKGAPHGLCTTQKDEVNADLLAFIKG